MNAGNDATHQQATSPVQFKTRKQVKTCISQHKFSISLDCVRPMAYSPKRSLSKRPRKSEVALSEVTDALKNAAINNNQEQPSVVRSKSMPTLGARIFSEINIDFPDVLTDVTCSELIIELVKYILFMKEQIPYQYNQLKYVVDRKKKWDLEKKVDGAPVKIKKPTAILAEKHYRKACSAIESLENTFQSIRQEMHIADSFALVIGATVATPQELYIVELPPLLKVPKGSPPSRNCHTRLLREMIGSEDLQRLIGKPFHPTNTFLLLHKKGSVNKESCFDPKPNYSLPKRTQRVVLKFHHPANIEDPSHFKVFTDDGVEAMECETESKPAGSIWYQAKAFVSGFKDCWIGDECATEVWLKV